MGCPHLIHPGLHTRVSLVQCPHLCLPLAACHQQSRALIDLPHTPASSSPTGSWWHATYHLATTIATPAAYAALPNAFSGMGWIGGVICLFCGWTLSCYNSLLLCTMFNHNGKRHERYAHLAREIYGEALMPGCTRTSCPPPCQAKTNNGTWTRHPNHVSEQTVFRLCTACARCPGCEDLFACFSSLVHGT